VLLITKNFITFLPAPKGILRKFVLKLYKINISNKLSVCSVVYLACIKYFIMIPGHY